MTREDPVRHSRLVKNLNTSINEDHLSSTISHLTDKVKKIESVSGRSLHTIKLRGEIEKLEDQLSYSRNQANLQVQHCRKNKF